MHRAGRSRACGAVRAVAGLLGGASGSGPGSTWPSSTPGCASTGRATGLVAAVALPAGPAGRPPGERVRQPWPIASAAVGGGSAEHSALDGLEAGAVGRGVAAEHPPGRRPLPGDRAAAGRWRRRCAASPGCRGTGRQRGRTELASSVAGDSHALDDGSVLGALVLRAIAGAVGAPAGRGGGAPAALGRAGVLSDEVSTTVLTLGLRPPGVRRRPRRRCGRGPTPGARRTRPSATSAGSTARAARDRRSRCARTRACSKRRWTRARRQVVVCTAGNPTVVVTTLLERLVADGATLRYHGDFDWPGVAIANRVITRSVPRRGGWEPPTTRRRSSGRGPRWSNWCRWRAVRSLPSGTPACQPRWSGAGGAVHEEAMLDVLVADLTGRSD